MGMKFFLTLVAVIVVSTWLTFGSDAGHDLYCWGRVDSVTIGC